MAIPEVYALATDGEFRLLAQLGRPPRAGQVASVLPSGQVTVDMDDPDGGTATAWPLNGFTYAVGDVVYVSFASDAADSGIVVGSKAPVPLVALASIPDALLRDGSRTLTADWDIGDTRRVLADGVRARNGAGLRLEDDAGNLGVFVEDGGEVGIGTDSPLDKLHIIYSDSNASFVGLRISNTSTDTTGAYSGIFTRAENGNVRCDWFSVPTTGVVLSGGGMVFRTQSNHPIAFHTNNSEKVRITNTGSVGIGTTSPGAKLDVDGTARIAPSAALPALYVGRATGQPNIKATDPYLIMDSDTNFAAVNYYVNQDVLLAFGGGRVGIGLTAPQGELHAHDGTGGMLFVTKTNIGATAQTIIPNGTGDVVRGIAGDLVATDGVGVVANAFNILNPGTLDVAVGSLTLRLEVTAAGALTAKRQSGTGTATLALLATWV